MDKYKWCGPYFFGNPLLASLVCLLVPHLIWLCNGLMGLAHILMGFVFYSAVVTRHLQPQRSIQLKVCLILKKWGKQIRRLIVRTPSVSIHIVSLPAAAVFLRNQPQSDEDFWRKMKWCKENLCLYYYTPTHTYCPQLIACFNTLENFRAS